MSTRSDPVEIARFLELPLDDYDDNQCTSSATAYCYEPYLDQQQKVSANSDHPSAGNGKRSNAFRIKI